MSKIEALVENTFDTLGIDVCDDLIKKMKLHDLFDDTVYSKEERDQLIIEAIHPYIREGIRNAVSSASDRFAPHF